MRIIKRFNWLLNKDFIYKILIFITTVTIIVGFLPQEDKFNYQFDINKPWKYGLLQASFDFPIYKSKSQIKKEQDSLMSSYQPYFNIDSKTEEKTLDKFRDDYNHNLKNILPSYHYYIYI